MKNFIYTSILLLCFFTACRRDDITIPPEEIHVTPPEDNKELIGFYLLNEGNMGSNKSTLDYFDYTTGNYHRNIYGYANPNVPMELGDVGNDLKIYGGKLYAVINCSNKIEVMDKFTAKRVGKIEIPNCRYINFYEGYAYVTSYAGPVEINQNYEQIGYVAKIDTATFEIIDRCLVGFQPDEIEIVDFPIEGGLRGAKIYVANSGGYMVPNYETTVSVIDIQSFKEIKRINVAINLHRLKADKHGNLWVSSRGDYYDEPSRLHWIDTQTDTYGGTLPVAVTDMTLDGDSLYLYSTEFNYNTFKNIVTYGIIDVTKKEIVTHNFITDGTDKQITLPNGIMVNPCNKDIYLTDGANSVFPGALICYDKFGKKKWQVQTGDIPAHFAMLYK